MADFSKWPFFKIANSQNIFKKISQSGHWAKDDLDLSKSSVMEHEF